MGKSRAVTWAADLLTGGRRAAQTGAAGTARSTTGAGARVASRARPSLLARGIRGATGLVIADYAVEIAVNEAAQYSDFVNRNRENITDITTIMLIVFGGGLLRGGKSGINALKARWAGWGKMPSIFPISKINLKGVIPSSNLASVKVWFDGVGVRVAKEGRELGKFVMTEEGKRRSLLFAGTMSFATLIGSHQFGGSFNWANPSDSDLEDLRVLIAALITEDEGRRADGAVARFAKEFDVLDLWGSPRYVAEAAMKKWPSLSPERIFAIIDAVKYLVEEDTPECWYVVGVNDAQQVCFSFNGTLLREVDGVITSTSGLIAAAAEGTSSDDVIASTAIAGTLASLFNTSSQNGGVALLPVSETLSSSNEVHPVVQRLKSVSEQSVFASEVYSNVYGGVTAHLQLVVSGSSVFFITRNFCDLEEGPEARLLAHRTLSEVLS